MCQSSSRKQNENQAIQALSKKPKIFRVLIFLAGWIQDRNYSNTRLYGGKIICVMASISFFTSL